MKRPRRKAGLVSMNEVGFAVKQRKRVPYEFVLDALAPVSPWTRPMFGCLAVYIDDKIVLVLREKGGDKSADDGVWLATTKERHESLRREFPNMRSIKVLGKKVTGWQILAADTPDFEQAALRACELIVGRDPRIGKVPQSRRASRRTSKMAAKR
ncbi:MAG TPA: hypothetical protein VGR72_00335 [Candidatus Acidoferrales bacterium]|nr:hypothetical protein [Candidatus Acidoferrales bacterium]